MNTSYLTQIKIRTDIETVWNAVTQPTFTPAFLPEIKKDLSGMGEYIRKTHRNAAHVFADYMIPHRAMGWTTGAGINIALPRKDVYTNIESIDFRFIEKSSHTIVTIEVIYTPKLNKHYFFVHRCIRGLMNMKLKVLKQELETDTHQAGWETALA